MLPVIFSIIALTMFLFSKNIAVSLITFFSLFYYSQVVFVDQIYGLSFSPSADRMLGLEINTMCLFVFVTIFSLFNLRINTNFSFKNEFSLYRSTDLLLSIPIIIYALFLLESKGIRLDGSFVETTDIRYVIEDYISLLVVVIVIASKARWMIVMALLILSLSYLLAGERMRFAFLIVPIYFLFAKKAHSYLFKIALFAGLFLFEIVSFLRSGIGSVQDGYKITHFGSVTISSLHLFDYTSVLSAMEKFNFLIGIFIGNLIPSMFLPSSYNIRLALPDFVDIPGGGWLSSWFYALGGWVGLLLFSIIFSLFCRRLFVNLHKQKNNPNIHMVIFMILFVVTLPRWFMYTPYQVIRFPLYGLILFFLYRSINRIIHYGIFTKHIKPS